MSETLDNVNTVNTAASKRPVFLTVLCILSFIAAGIGIILLLLASGARGVADAADTTVADAMTQSTPGVDTAAIDAANTVFTWPYIITALILTLIGLLGVIQMWKLKKSGFYIYTFTQIAGIIVPIVFGLEFPILGTFMAVVFIVMYAANLKAMR